MGSVTKVIWWRGWAIRAYAGGRWQATKRWDDKTAAAIFTGSKQVGSVIQSILLHEGIYRGAGFVNRAKAQGTSA